MMMCACDVGICYTFNPFRTQKVETNFGFPELANVVGRGDPPLGKDHFGIERTISFRRDITFTSATIKVEYQYWTNVQFKQTNNMGCRIALTTNPHTVDLIYIVDKPHINDPPRHYQEFDMEGDKDDTELKQTTINITDILNAWLISANVPAASDNVMHIYWIPDEWEALPPSDPYDTAIRTEFVEMCVLGASQDPFIFNNDHN